MTFLHRIVFASVGYLLLSSLGLPVVWSAEDVERPASGPSWSPRRPGEKVSAAASLKTASKRVESSRSDRAESAADERDEAQETERKQSKPAQRTAAKVERQAAAISNVGSLKAPIALPAEGVPILPPIAPANEGSSWILGPNQCNEGYAAAAQPAWPTFGRFWVRPEYLMWWTEAASIPPLVTTGGTGALGAPGTTTLFGGDEINDDWRSGGRLSAGIWLNPSQVTGIEGNVFALKQESTTFADSRTAPAFLGRPFFNLQTLAEDARLVPGPGFTTGSIAIQADTDLHGGELLLRRLISQNAPFPTAVLVGYRYLRLEDSLVINESQTGPGGASVALFDSFETTNTFHGVDVGVISELRRNRWTLELVGKLALGSMHSEAVINGARTTVTPPAAAVTTVGGLLAQSTNIGSYEQDDFAVIPELGATVGFNITQRWKGTVGYTFLYVSRVARAFEQIDRDLNLPLVPGPNTVRPQFAFEMTDFWAQGLNLGLEFNY